MKLTETERRYLLATVRTPDNMHGYTGHFFGATETAGHMVRRGLFRAVPNMYTDDGTSHPGAQRNYIITDKGRAALEKN